MWHTPINPESGKQRQEDQEFKVSVSYTANSRPDWATQDTASKMHEKEYVQVKIYYQNRYVQSAAKKT